MIAINETIVRRFWAKVEIGDGCWLWTGATAPPRHYGQMRDAKQRVVGAHRLSYTLHHGPILGRLVVCHSCDTPQCVRPGHLFLGTSTVNLYDAIEKGRIHKPWVRMDLGLDATCSNGHRVTPEIVYDNPNGRRHCRICRAEWSRKAHAKAS